MNRISVTKLLVVLAMLLSIAGGPAVALPGGGAGMVKVCAKKCCCGGTGVCAMQRKQRAQEQPAPVQQRVGQELGAAVTGATFSVLFAVEPTAARYARRELFADGHGPGVLVVSCIRLI